MESALYFVVIFCVFLLSLWLTGRVRQYALQHVILDIPNERSLHVTPIPRVGGLAIVAIFLLIILSFTWLDKIELNLCYALCGGGGLIAFIGYCDDLYTIKARYRLLTHFIVALWAVYWLDGLQSINLGTIEINLSIFGHLVTVIAIVWCINFYNFMDGIDGLAGSEGIFISIMSGIMLWLLGKYDMAIILLLLSATIAGFTIWNWAPAKIFLGDVGSGFLGYVFAVLALATVNTHDLPIAFWIILLSVFLWDATFTLFSRIYQGKVWYEAHKDHAYHQFIIYGATHKQVTLGISMVNLVFLSPMAYTLCWWPEWTLLFLGLSVSVIWCVWYWIQTQTSQPKASFTEQDHGSAARMTKHVK